MTPLTCGCASVSPSVQSLLVTVKLGTWGRKSYGFGGVGRSAMAVAPRCGGGFPSWTLGRAQLGRPAGRVGLAGRRSPSATQLTGFPALRAGSVPGVSASGPLGLPASVRACLFDLDGVLT